ncbi:unnamed protein product [Staurois parvus]|uniref:Uncharacterized protein n=1 Tax=Staurois parvus TaxID=386267 RepID=A0ABN9AIV8_9NEOB|nr:unnamed protein product [Staurois parvus]
MTLSMHCCCGNLKFGVWRSLAIDSADSWDFCVLHHALTPLCHFMWPTTS